MIQCKADVKSAPKPGEKRVLVGVAKYPEFETLEEALQHMIPGDPEASKKEVLRLVNVQTKTNAMNAVRQSATQKPTKQALLMKAIQRIPHTDLVSLQSDEAAFKARVDQEIAKLEQEYEQNRLQKAQELVASGEAEGDDDDDDETTGQ
jgi:hypothetical protein